MDVGKGDLAGGDRARLVKTKDIHPGQNFNSRQLARKGIAPREGDYPSHEGQARQQHQAIGDHRHSSRDRSLQRVLPTLFAQQRQQ